MTAPTICSGTFARGTVAVSDCRERGRVPVAYTIGLRLYEGHESFVTAARRYNGADMHDAGACFQPTPDRWYLSGDGGEWLKRKPTTHAGVMRLVLPELCHEVVAHEATHAALSVYRLGVDENAVFNETVSFEREEDICFLVGEITDRVVGWLRTVDGVTL